MTYLMLFCIPTPLDCGSRAPAFQRFWKNPTLFDPESFRGSLLDFRIEKIAGRRTVQG